MIDAIETRRSRVSDIKTWYVLFEVIFGHPYDNNSIVMNADSDIVIVMTEMIIVLL